MLFHNCESTGWIECFDGFVVTSTVSKHYYNISPQSADIKYVHLEQSTDTFCARGNIKTMTEAHELPYLKHTQTVTVITH